MAKIFNLVFLTISSHPAQRRFLTQYNKNMPGPIDTLDAAAAAELGETSQKLTATPAQYAELKATLLNESGSVPLAKRFRALFTLRNLKSHEAIDIIGQGRCLSVSSSKFRVADCYARIGFKDSSALLGHELAYVLGQIDDPHALPVLESVLRDEQQHPMVRHEV